jgi:hypothetical protein
MIHLDILRREVREEDAALARHASRTAVSHRLDVTVSGPVRSRAGCRKTPRPALSRARHGHTEVGPG